MSVFIVRELRCTRPQNPHPAAAGLRYWGLRKHFDRLSVTPCSQTLKSSQANKIPLYGLKNGRRATSARRLFCAFKSIFASHESKGKKLHGPCRHFYAARRGPWCAGGARARKCIESRAARLIHNGSSLSGLARAWTAPGSAAAFGCPFRKNQSHRKPSFRCGYYLLQLLHLLAKPARCVRHRSGSSIFRSCNPDWRIATHGGLGGHCSWSATSEKKLPGLSFARGVYLTF